MLIQSQMQEAIDLLAILAENQAIYRLTAPIKANQNHPWKKLMKENHILRTKDKRLLTLLYAIFVKNQAILLLSAQPKTKQKILVQITRTISHVSSVVLYVDKKDISLQIAQIKIAGLRQSALTITTIIIKNQLLAFPVAKKVTFLQNALKKAINMQTNHLL